MLARRSPTAPSRGALVALGLLLVGWSAIAIASLRQSSATIDEYGYVASARNLIESFDPRYSEWHAPLVNYLLGVPLLGLEIAPAPPPDGAPSEARFWFWNNGERFEVANATRYAEIVNRARLASVALSLALALLVFAWARALAPPETRDAAGLLAALLTLMHPELLAHGRLATLDVGVTFFGVMALFALYRYVVAPGFGRAAALGVALGLAQGAKFTSILFALCAAIAFAVLLASRATRNQHGARRMIGQAAVVAGLALFTLHALYGFSEPWSPLASMRFQSERMQAIAAGAPSWAGVPLPRAYVQAFDLQLLDQQGQYRCYLEGTTIQGGRLDYFFVLFLRKSPEALLLLALLALVAWVWKGPRRARDSALLLGPALLVFAVFSLSQKQIGLRMAMPVIPLVAIWIAAVSPLLILGTRIAQGTWALAFLGALGTLLVHPYYLSYFNLSSGGPYEGYRHALGSNCDWGQDLPALRAWMEREGVPEIELFSYGRVDPATYGIRYRVPLDGPRPDARYLAVSASFYGMAYPLNDHGRRIPVDLSAQRQALFENPAYELHERVSPAWFVFRRKGR